MYNICRSYRETATWSRTLKVKENEDEEDKHSPTRFELLTLILIYVIPANGEIGLLEATKGLYRH